MNFIKESASGQADRAGSIRRLTLGLFLMVMAHSNSGCATMIRGPMSTVAIKSEPSGATIYIDGIRQEVQTPAMAKLSRTRHDIGLEKDGHLGQQRVIESCWYWPASPLLIPDALFLGMGVVLDAMTGGFLDLQPNAIQCQLAQASAATTAKNNQRIVAYRPPVAKGKGVLQIYHANQLPAGAKLFVMAVAKAAGQSPGRGEQRESLVTMDVPVTLDLTPGSYVVNFRKLSEEQPVRREVLVEENKIVYLRAMSRGTLIDVEKPVWTHNGSRALPDVAEASVTHWTLTIENIQESEALVDLYYLNNFQNALDHAYGAPDTSIEPITQKGGAL